MNNRLLIPNMVLLKRWIAEQFSVATRIIYSDHPVYTYSDTDEETGIVIMPTFADTDVPGKKPKILSQGGGYDLTFQDTLGRNFAQELIDETTGMAIGKKYVKQIRMNMMVLVQAYAEEESSDIADELAILLGSIATHVYADHGLVLYSVSVSETNVLNPEEKSFQTVVSLGLDVILEINETYPQDGIDLEFGFDVISRKTSEPGVRVIPESRQ